MAEFNHSFRGVLVYIVPKGEIHQQLSFYTENGMVHVMAYGARKSKNLHKRTLSVFTMGKVLVTKRKSNMYTFKDIEVYRNGEHLGYNLMLYYSACVCVELVRYLVGADHHAQFKLLVDVLLYLIDSNTVHWKESLAFFLWQSLANNGWQPDFSTIAVDTVNSTDSQQQWVLSQNGTIKPFINNNTHTSSYGEQCILSAPLVSVLQLSSQLNAKIAIETFAHIHTQSLSQFIHFLIYQWSSLLGRKLLSVSFLQKYV